MYCPYCGADVFQGNKICPSCKRTIPFSTIDAQTGKDKKKDEKSETLNNYYQELKSKKSSIIIDENPPGIIWILPILFGLIGGGFAALIASLKYDAPWIRYVILGFLVSIAVALIWLVSI
jgi:hypothetical protein